MDKLWLKHYPPGVPAEIDVNEYASLRDVFDESVAKYAVRPAFTCMGKSITFGELDTLSAAFGAWLQGIGGVKGTRVALMMPNILQYPIALFGTLRAGSVWAPEPSFALINRMSSVVDNTFLPASTAWNSGTLWWDQDPSVNSGLVTFEIDFSSIQTMNRFVVQADDNDTYQLDFWNGAGWQSAWSIAAVGGWGMQTRDSGILPAITTDRLRFYGTGGDNYLAVSEIQAYGVPAPGTLALLGLGLAGLGALRRRKA